MTSRKIGSATASVYGQYGNTAYAGTKTAYAGGGVAGVSGSGSYSNKATGGSGNYATNKSYNAMNFAQKRKVADAAKAVPRPKISARPPRMNASGPAPSRIAASPRCRRAARGSEASAASACIAAV